MLFFASSKKNLGEQKQHSAQLNKFLIKAKKKDNIGSNIYT